MYDDSVNNMESQMRSSGARHRDYFASQQQQLLARPRASGFRVVIEVSYYLYVQTIDEVRFRSVYGHAMCTSTIIT